MKILDNSARRQAHWLVAQSDTHPKSAKEFASPTNRQLE